MAKSFRWVVAASAATLLAIPLSACEAPETEPVAGPTQTAPQPDLSKFYEQDFTWRDCGAAKKCGELEVPVDYDKPDGATLKLSVNKVSATMPDKRLGSLVVNPGGPGGSGVEYASFAPLIVSPKVLSRYDIVGFDPRGVGGSAAVWCLRGQEMDDYLGLDPSPDTPEEQQRTQDEGKKFGEACQKNSPELLPHLSTREVAKDMDVLRAALREDKLNFLGKSYGTFLGATYAGLFPDKVGRFVLDGVLAPDLTSTEMSLGQAEGFERATRAYVTDCVAKSGCPLGTSVDEGLKNLQGFIKSLDTKPLPVTKDARVKELTEGWGFMGVIQPMYRASDWPMLTAALREGMTQGKGDKLMALADQYAGRSADGNYSNNMLQVINGVNCLDRPDSANLDDFRKEIPVFEQKSPTFGSSLVWGGVTCGVWPVKGVDKPEKIRAAGSAPILVVGTTRDPATPYEWAQRLADQLENGHLVTFEGDGHTAYYKVPTNNACLDGAVDAYLTEGTVPAKGLTCR